MPQAEEISGFYIDFEFQTLVNWFWWTSIFCCKEIIWNNNFWFLQSHYFLMPLSWPKNLESLRMQCVTEKWGVYQIRLNVLGHAIMHQYELFVCSRREWLKRNMWWSLSLTTTVIGLKYFLHGAKLINKSCMPMSMA